MASLMSNAAVTTASSAAQANMVAPFTGLKSTSAFPVSRKSNIDITTLASNGGRVQCMQVWPPRNLKKFETLSYLPPLSEESLLKEINYLLVKGWVPCIEFEVGPAFVYRENNKSPGYYDGRYWTMWKLPMFGCTDGAQVAAEVEEAKKAYPDAHIRIIGFDSKRQVQCISFIAYKPTFPMECDDKHSTSWNKPAVNYPEKVTHQQPNLTQHSIAGAETSVRLQVIESCVCLLWVVVLVWLASVV